jgi:TRAP-type C4-dicarboxylate transport system permease small subunit
MQALRARLRRIAEVMAALLFLAMFAAFLLQVFTRYILNDPVTWTQEFVLIAYIWVVFWCAAFLLQEQDHITFDMLFVSLAPRLRRWLAVALTALTGAVFVASLPGTIDYVGFMKIERSPVMGIRFDLLYSIFVVFVAAVAIAAAARIWRLLGRGWQQEVRRDGEVEP